MIEGVNGAVLEGSAQNNIPIDDFSLFNSASTINLKLENDCIEHMRMNGIQLAEVLISDGEIHRFSMDHKHTKKDEWYVARFWEHKGKIYFSCDYGSWSKNSTYAFKSWEVGICGLNSDELVEIRRHENQIRLQIAEAKKKRQDEAALEAQSIWERALEVPPTDKEYVCYLMLKGVKAHNARFCKNLQGYDSLVLPIRNALGELRSLQFISVSNHTTFKSFLPGGEKRGCYSILGELMGATDCYVSEGFATAATVYEAKNIPTVIAFDCGNLDPVIDAIRSQFPHLRITIAADNDIESPNNPGRKKAEEAAKKYGCKIVFPKFPNDFKLSSGNLGSDFNDIHCCFGLDEVRRQLQWKTRLKPVNVEEMLSRHIPPKKLILKPWLREKDLVMIYAERGLGKTWLALSIACAIASKANFLNFEAIEANRVLYVDGEMPACIIKDRLKIIISSINTPISNPNFFQILNQDLDENRVRDLGSDAGQQDINELIDQFDVLILDNLSSLIQSGDENEAGSWVSVQEWLLNLRKMGKTVVFIHHAGKKGLQRGTSKKEDILDTVIALKKPKDWSASDGARFEVHYEKNRSFAGDEAKSFEARLVTTSQGLYEWKFHDIKGDKIEEAMSLNAKGLNQIEIAQALGVDKSTISRWMKKPKK